MACSCLNLPLPRRALACVSLAALWLALPADAAPPSAQRELPVQVVARDTKIDYRNNATVLTDVTITQGENSIRADRAEGNASGVDFRNSRWVFIGNVIMHAQQAASRGVLNSDRAVIDFRHNQLARAVATGQPAHFEQTASDNGVLARAHADTIDYEVPDSTLRLTSDAWLLYGTTEVKAPLVVYNIVQQKMESAAGGPNGERVQITIVPQSSAKPKGKS